MKRSIEEIEYILAGFRAPDRNRYPELRGYSREEIYQDFFGGGGLYLATCMARTLRLQPEDNLHVGEGGHNYVYWVGNFEMYLKWLTKDW